MNVKSTMDYSIFKRLAGNRDVTNKRVAIIKASIQSVGYISNPIIVNEKMEVIDGQGRLEALKQLNMPVEYRIIKNLGIQECRAMNLKPTAWTIEDFCKSYAEYGNENYIRLLELNNSFGFSIGLVFSIIKTSCIRSDGRTAQNFLRNGTFVFTEKEYEKTKTILEYLKRFEKIQKTIRGSKSIFYGCIAWISEQEGVDKERLFHSIQNNKNRLTPFSDIPSGLDAISDLYNFNYGKNNRRYFKYEYIGRNKDE